MRLGLRIWALTRGSVDSGDAHRDRPTDHRGGRRLTTSSDRPRRPGRCRPRDRRWSSGPRPGSRTSPGPSSIGVDANAASMAEASRRAARSAAEGRPAQRSVRRRGRRAHAVRALRRRRRADDLVPVGFAAPRRARARRGGRRRASPRCSRLRGVATATFSIEDRDGLGPAAARCRWGRATALAERWSGPRPSGLRASARRSAAEIAATRSTWARRLAAGRDRAVWRLELHR